jgi:DNA-binding LytR/AlgR family response regulator
LKSHAIKSAAGEAVPELDYFFVNAEYSLVKVVMDEIIMIEGLKDYVKIHLTNNKPLIIRISMKSIEEKLSAKKFIRIHKSYIVSIARITSIRKGSVFLGNTELPLSDNYKEAFMAAIGQ